MKKLYFTVREEVYDDVKEMKEHYKHNTLSETMRFCFLQQFGRMQKERFGYKGSSQKISKQEQSAQNETDFREMAQDPERLTKRLREIGYISDTFDKENTDHKHILVAEKNEIGQTVLMSKTIEISTGRVVYSFPHMDLPELILDLKKDGKL